MEKASFKQYKGKQIYFVDYSNLKTEEEFLKAINNTNQFRKQNIENKPLKSLLMLVDFRNSYVIGNVFNRLKESGALTKPFLKKQAMVGLTPGKAAMLKIYSIFIKDVVNSFNTNEEALEWLIKE